MGNLIFFKFNNSHSVSLWRPICGLHEGWYDYICEKLSDSQELKVTAEEDMINGVAKQCIQLKKT